MRLLVSVASALWSMPKLRVSSSAKLDMECRKRGGDQEPCSDESRIYFAA